ncbi:MAG TPA: ABC transporter ATP-binding protein [Bauldia sp.]|nr:ABC transporter ATP-binding protein [Bauldia sp.]
MSGPVLDISDLHVALGGRSPRPLLRGVSLAIAPGEVRGLVGESGAGKSMIARAVFGMLPGGARITRGRIAFAGRDLGTMPVAERRALLGAQIALIPQDPMTSLNPVKRIGDQIGTLLRLKLGLDRTARRETAVALLADVAIRDPRRVVELYPHELSGGMRQRILIAMAFAASPRLVIADEPTTALDVTVQRQILRLIHDLQHRLGSAVLFVTHNFGLVAKLCQRVTVLYAGRVVEEGATAALLAEPRAAYTRALLAATPRLDRPAEALAPLPRTLTDTLVAEARAYDAANPAAYR